MTQASSVFKRDPFRVLLVENIHPRAKEVLEREGCVVQMESHAPSEVELLEMVRRFDVIGLRSKTRLTKPVLDANPDLISIGAFCIGTDQIDTERAGQCGIPVFNAPYSNTRSVAELVMAEIVALSRQLGDRNNEAHRGGWLKSAVGSHEVRGKTLGIVGYGHIGSQVSVLAEAFGMRVLFFDIVKKLPLGNSQRTESLTDLLKASDFVTLHVPDTPQTRHMIAAPQLQVTRRGVHLINASRGGVVDIDALAAAIKSGHVGGAAVDVFPQEPSSNQEKFSSPLQGLRNVILTPHIGGSTEEAQEAIGVEVAESLLRFLKTGSTRGAVNFPNVDLPIMHTSAHRMLNVHQNVPGVLGEINSIVSDLGVNIQAQSLSTNAAIGYLVMDMEKGEADQVGERVKSLPTSIKTRVLY
ncbi:MAG: phosphoglycerate dehydrogenase [Bdellovibrionaceae bacterium]|nr:phosphoglycerate dehydrogenase [Pseudobdellovibrionaceae bacterium]